MSECNPTTTYCVDGAAVECSTLSTCFDLLVEAHGNGSTGEKFVVEALKRRSKSFICISRAFKLTVPDGYPMISCSSELKYGNSTGVCYCYTDFLLTGGDTCQEVDSVTVVLLTFSSAVLLFILLLFFVAGSRVKYVRLNLAGVLLCLMIVQCLIVMTVCVLNLVYVFTQSLNGFLYSFLYVFYDMAFQSSAYVLAFMWWQIHKQILSTKQQRLGGRFIIALTIFVVLYFGTLSMLYLLASISISAKISPPNDSTTYSDLLKEMEKSIDILNGSNYYLVYVIMHFFYMLIAITTISTQGYLIVRALSNCIDNELFKFKLNFWGILRDSFTCTYGALGNEEQNTVSHSDLIMQAYLITRTVIMVIFSMVLKLVGDSFLWHSQVHSYEYADLGNLGFYIFTYLASCVFWVVVFSYLYRSSCFSIPAHRETSVV